jgi:hypothetical protein
VDPLLVKVVTGMVTVLCGVIGLLWKEVHKWQLRYLNERQKRIDDAKEHYQTSEIFLRTLEKLRSRSSERPPSYR